MSTALVTGGAGFVGSHLVERLLSAGVAVRVLDDLSTGREANLAGVRDDVAWWRADVRDADRLGEALRGVDVVFHQAAVPSVPQSLAEPERTHAVNLTATLGLLEAARRADVGRVVFASSCAVYGARCEGALAEDAPARPASPYALQKLAAEGYCRLACELWGLETVALRYFNVYGPRQDPRSDYAAVIPRFARAGLAGRPARLFGDGEQTRDFVSVEDVVEANWRAWRAPGAAGAVVNVASGRRTSLNELLGVLGGLLGAGIRVEHGPPRPGDVRHSLADLRRARALLDFEPAVDLATGLARTLDQLDKQREAESAT